jgi:hypothetical protein
MKHSKKAGLFFGLAILMLVTACVIPAGSDDSDNGNGNGNGNENGNENGSGNDSTKTVASIAVTRQPSKKAYGIREPFDTTGLEVTATYTDNTTGAVTIGESDLDYDFSTLGGSKTVTIYKGGKSVQITGITVQTLLQRVEAASSGDIITVYADENIPPGITLNKTITIKGSGAERTIGQDDTGTFITVGAGGNLTLDGNITLNGMGKAGRVVFLNNAVASLTMKAGSKITGGISTALTTGGVCVNLGVFTMEGGSVTGNASGYGADVMIYPTGTFRLSGAAQIGVLAVAANSSGGSCVTLTGSFTGSIGSLDLWNRTGGSSTANYYRNSTTLPVLKAGSGVTLTQTVIDKFPLRYFQTTSDYFSLSGKYIDINGYLR